MRKYSFIKKIVLFNIKILSIISIVVTSIFLFSVSPQHLYGIRSVQASTNNKVVNAKKINIPKNWQGHWYAYYGKNIFASIYLYSHGLSWLNSYGSYYHYNPKDSYSSLWAFKKVTGTNKYPWQMSEKWKEKNLYGNQLKDKQYKGSWKKYHGRKWLMQGSNGDKYYLRALCLYHFRKNGKTYKVLLGSGDETSKVYFSSKKLAKKFKNYSFSNIKRPL